MRIISGTHKGRRISAPKSLPVRPTTDLAKESLFNILNNRVYFEEIAVLDLFAGTGNISYEFASRGTENITSVDQDYGCVRFISKTAEAFAFPINAIKADVFKYIIKLNAKYDVIFADPPYDFSEDTFLELVQKIIENQLLNKDGMIIIEHSTHTDLSTHANFRESRKYGSSIFSFFE